MYPNTKSEFLQRYSLACNFTQKIDVAAITANIKENYMSLGLRPKKLVQTESFPELYSRIKKESMWDASWVSILCAGAYQIDKSDMSTVMRIFYPIFQALESGLWLYAYLDDCFLWLPIPRVQTTDDNKPHCSTGPAFKLPKQEIYYLNGVLVNKSLVMTPAEKIDPRILLREKNAEVRREIVRKIGIERVCLKLGAKTLDKSGEYELISLNLNDNINRPYLKMKNPSTGTYHVEGVPPNIATVRAALAWRNNTDIAPDILT